MEQRQSGNPGTTTAYYDEHTPWMSSKEIETQASWLLRADLTGWLVCCAWKTKRRYSVGDKLNRFASRCYTCTLYNSFNRRSSTFQSFPNHVYKSYWISSNWKACVFQLHEQLPSRVIRVIGFSLSKCGSQWQATAQGSWQQCDDTRTLSPRFKLCDQWRISTVDQLRREWNSILVSPK